MITLIFRNGRSTLEEALPSNSIFMKNGERISDGVFIFSEFHDRYRENEMINFRRRDGDIYSVRFENKGRCVIFYSKILDFFCISTRPVTSCIGLMWQILLEIFHVEPSFAFDDSMGMYLSENIYSIGKLKIHLEFRCGGSIKIITPLKKKILFTFKIEEYKKHRDSIKKCILSFLKDEEQLPLLEGERVEKSLFDFVKRIVSSKY